MRTPHFVNEGSPGITQTAGVAAALTKILAYQVQPGSRVVLDRDTVIMLKDRGATETADKSKAEIKLVNPNQKNVVVLAQTSYRQLKFNQDTAIQFHPVRGNLEYQMQPYSYLEIWLNSDQTVATANLDFILEAKEEPL